MYVTSNFSYVHIANYVSLYCSCTCTYVCMNKWRALAPFCTAIVCTYTHMLPAIRKVVLVCLSILICTTVKVNEYDFGINILLSSVWCMNYSYLLAAVAMYIHFKSIHACLWQHFIVKVYYVSYRWRWRGSHVVRINVFQIPICRYVHIYLLLQAHHYTYAIFYYCVDNSV